MHPFFEQAETQSARDLSEECDDKQTAAQKALNRAKKGQIPRITAYAG
jgi:hypothetical protein